MTASTIEILPYKITREQVTHPDKKIQYQLEKVYSAVMNNAPGIIQRLKPLASKYPDVPQFRNYLVQAYYSSGNYTQAQLVNDGLLKDFPDYFFAKVFDINLLIYNGKLEEPERLLGINLKIEDAFPGRSEFHIGEVMSYLTAAVNHSIESGNLEKTEETVRFMKSIDKEHPNLIMAESAVKSFQLKKVAERYLEAAKSRRKPLVKKFDSAAQTTNKPFFNHPEVENFYKVNLRVSRDFVEQILNLPKQTLLDDLHTVLSDGINRYQYFKLNYHDYESDFVTHTLFFLMELKSESSFPHLLNFLRQGEEIPEYWLGDYFLEDFWEAVYYSGQNRLEELQSFMREPNQDVYCKNVISTTVQQIGLHNPERKQEVVKWYADLFNFLLNNADDDDITDTELNAFLVSDAGALSEPELSDLSKKFFDENLVDLEVIGSFDEITRYISPESEKRELVTGIYNRYDEALTWPYYANEEDLHTRIEPEHNFLPKKPVVSTIKIERNNPCPCGSGKKYKKCCME